MVQGSSLLNCAPVRGLIGSNPILSAINHVGFMASHSIYGLSCSTCFLIDEYSKQTWFMAAVHLTWCAALSGFIICYMHYVYVLKSQNRNWIYVGSTKDLKRRFQQHERGETQSTKAYRPLKIIHYEAYLTTSDATRREIYLKTTKGKSTLRMMLRDSLLVNDGTIMESVVE